MRQAEDGAYDAIFLDAFTIGGRIPFHLVTREFFALCREKLARGGVFVMNINSAHDGPMSPIFHSMYKTIDAVFPGSDAGVCRWGGSLAIRRRSRRTSSWWRSTAAKPCRPTSGGERAAAVRVGSYVGRRQVQRMVGRSGR